MNRGEAMGVPATLPARSPAMNVGTTTQRTRLTMSAQTAFPALLRQVTLFPKLSYAPPADVR